MGIQFSFLGLKIVVIFNVAFNLTQVTNFWNNTLKPNLATILITKLDQGFKVGYTLGKKDSIHQREDGKFEIYGKLWLTGEAKDGLTIQQIRTAKDELFDDLKVEMKTALLSNNATNITFHVHRTTGDVNET
jgi:hypothetical protein